MDTPAAAPGRTAAPRRITKRTRGLRLLATGAVLLWVGILAASTSAAPAYTGWSAPVNLGPTINTTFTEAGAAVSEDDLTLYFFSGRPGGSGGNDIWFTHRATPSDAWGAPVNAGSTLNSASDETNLSLSADGHWMYFSSTRPGGFGLADIWQSYRADIHDDLGWGTPTNLGPNVNTALSDSGPGYFDNEGAPQLYFGSDRPGGLGGSDIYVSDLQADGSGPGGPATAVPGLSSPQLDNRPNLRRDGLEIFLYSDRPGGVGGSDLWTATRASVASPWSTPVNLGATVNSSSPESHPNISASGRTLYFVSGRPGGAGGSDLYTTTRAAKLTVTANDQSRLFGQANLPLTATITGFVGGETAAVVSGTAACSTTATPSSPAGDYPITCTAGSLSAPGYVFETFVAGTLTVAYSRPCLTGPNVGPLRVAAGDAVCLSGIQTGPVTVAPGGSLDVEGGRITGPVVANGAAAVRICGAAITGPLTVSGSTGPVLVGGAGCAPNTVVGPVRVTDNSGGVEVNGNTVVGPLRVTGNAAPVHAAGNTVTGPVTIQP